MFGVVAAEHLLGQLEHPRKVFLRQAEQGKDHVEREIHGDLGDVVTLGPDVTHSVDVLLGQLVDPRLEIAHGLWPEPIRADRPHLSVVRVVHVDQGADADAGFYLSLQCIVGLGGGQQRAGFRQEQIVRALDGHDVGVLGDRPERPVRRVVDPRHRIVRPQMGECGVQPGVIGICRRIGQYLGGVVHGWRAHRAS